MASSGDWSDLRNACPLCLEPFRGRQPKILPCFHTFCLPCLTSLVGDVGSDREEHSEEEDLKSSKEQVLDDDKEKNCEDNKEDGEMGKTFNCPTCRKLIMVPEGGISQLQTNFYLDVEEPQEVMVGSCDLCPEDSSHEAKMKCEDCDIYLCAGCRRYHDRMPNSRGHKVRPLKQSKPADQEALNKKKWCPKHSDQALCFQCRQCDVSICLHCKLTSHEGHVTEEITVAAIRAKDELPKLVAKANNQIRIMELVLDRLDCEKRELQRQEQEIKFAIANRYEIIVNWAARARDESLERTEMIKKAAASDISAQIAAASSTVSKLAKFVKSAAHPSPIETEIVIMKTDFQAALHNEEDLAQFRQRGSKVSQPLVFDCQHDDKAVGVDQVRAYIGQIFEVNENTTSDKNGFTPVSIKEMVCKVESLQERFTVHLGDVKKLLDEYASRQKIVFHAWLQTTFTWPAGSVIVMSDVDINEGNGYCATTGKFTIPVNGLYVFIASISAHMINAIVGLMVDGTVEANISYPHYNSIFITSPCQIVKELKAGQQVWLESMTNCCMQGGRHTSFSGALLQATVSPVAE